MPDPSNVPPQTLVELLRRRAEHQPDQIAYRFLTFAGRGRGEAASLTHAQLDARARAIAVGLRREAEPGDRVLMLLPAGLDYISYFYGCLYAGLIAVPAYPPGSARHTGRVESIARDSGAKLIVGDRPAGTGDDAGAVANVLAARWLSPDIEIPQLANDWAAPRADAGTTAFLQYTSGSTSTPKGVVVSHGNLMANGAAAQASFGFSPETVGVSWLPPYHDMGLIGGIFFPMYTGFPVNLLSPMSFLRNPAAWLETITRYRATVSAAPNFAYQLAAQNIGDDVKDRLDLSSWTHALNGAEPVSARVIDEFCAAFRSSGFKRSTFVPCYGLAEGTLVVSGARSEAEPVRRFVSKSDLEAGRLAPPRALTEAQVLVSSGRIVEGTEVAIVDPATRAPVPDGSMGEIWVRGPAVAGGYFASAEATAAAFDRQLADGRGQYLITGDLGSLVDGELFVTGRASDLMIFRGRNIYPQDVEASSMASHPALAGTRSVAFSIDVDGDESLVVVQEVPRMPGGQDDLEAINKAIRTRISEDHQLRAYDVILVPRRTVPTTSSGKVQRKACKASYRSKQLQAIPTGPSTADPATVAAQLIRTPQQDVATESGELGGAVPTVSQLPTTQPVPPVVVATNAAHRPRTAADIERRLRELVAAHAAIDLADVDPGQPLTAYGLDSLRAVAVASELSDWLGREVPATFAWEYGSLAEAAVAIADIPSAAVSDGAQLISSPPPPPPLGLSTETPLYATPTPVSPATLTSAQAAAEPAVATHPTAPEPVAVVGVGCRFPGGVRGVEDFWGLLVGGRSGVGVVPADRWDVDAFFDVDPGVPGRTYSRHGGFVDGVREFDAGLFGVPPREAVGVDPQQRLMLEVAWEALEHAGVAPDSLRDSATGVFVGMSGSDYERLGLVAGDPAGIDAYSATGSAGNFGANRLSYVLGLRGPSLVVDTACSSSLVALHLAVNSLRAGECSTALVGGVNVMLSPDPTVALSKGRMLSVSGACHTFDAGADGYVRGEGCGVVVLRPLSAALAAGQDVLAVIRGSAINQDGRSNGLTAPSGSAQQEVVGLALERAGVLPAQVGYVEAHGTGTPLGDPIEVRALAGVLGRGRPVGRPVVLGSVKSNLGHLEAAAGIAGLIKAVLVVQRGVIPPHVGVRELSPHVAWSELPVRVGRELEVWSEPRRVAGVSSFGFGGTNAHVVLENLATTPDVAAAGSPAVVPGVVVVKVSGAVDAAVDAGAAELADFVQADPGVELPGVAWAANVGRADLPVRAAVVAGSVAELVAGLRVVAGGDGVRGRKVGGVPPRVGLLVPADASGVAGVFAGLYGRFPVITSVVDGFGSVAEWPLAVLVDPGPASRVALSRPEVAQPAVFAMAVALAAWWESVGVTADVLLGDGVGGFAAAVLAGVLTPVDGWALATASGRVAAGLITPAVAAELVGAVRCVPAIRSVVTDLFDPQDPAGLVDPTRWPGPDRHQAAGNRIPGLPGTETNLIIELGHGAQLGSATGVDRNGRPVVWLPSVAGTDSPRRLLESLGRVWTEGHAVDFSAAMDRPSKLPQLPTYPFQRETYWLPDRVVGNPRPKPVVAGPPAIERPMAGPVHAPTESAAAGPTVLHARLGVSAGAAELIGYLQSQLAPALGLADPGFLDPDIGLFDLGLTSMMVVELRDRLERELGIQVSPTAVFDHPTIRRMSDYLSAQVSEQPENHGAAKPVPAAPVLPGPQPGPERDQRDAAGQTSAAINTEAGQNAGAPAGAVREPDARASAENARISGPVVQTSSILPMQPIGDLADAVAIVGMGCRLPGGANDLARFWGLLSEGRDGTSQVPAGRWDDPAGATGFPRRGGFLNVPVDEFDPEAFGISPREARSMDPQQRLLLEVAWEALEDAGCTADAVDGTRTSVFLGINTTDYLQLLSAGKPEQDPYFATGNTFSIAAGRLSYFLGAQGPSLAIDTACSSSLVAVHLAIRSLRSGESSMSIVGGVNLMLSAATTASLAQLNALSPDGRCKTFDGAADGYGRGEGCGVVILKRLADAVESGDRIWAVMRGSAVNSDGRSAGLTVPNGTAQRAVIRQALQDSGVAPAQIGYVEAHGTGTPLGDPVELDALVDVLRPERSQDQPLLVGSVKTNVGHLEAAAGVSGLIKVALSLHHNKIPAHLHFDRPNTLIPWADVPVRVPQELTDWSTRGGLRFAGISSFGFSGTNAHVVLQEAPSVPAVATHRVADRSELLVISARTEDALAAAANVYRDFLAGGGTDRQGVAGLPAPVAAWPDITYSAAVHRSQLPYRITLVAKSASAAAEKLAAADQGAAPAAGRPPVRMARALGDGRRRLIFAYSGQGSQWAGMGLALANEPVAAAVLARCDARLRDLAGWSLLDELRAGPEASRLDDTRFAQPAIFAVQAALTELWRSYGVVPDAVLGHSVGEVAAAYALGALDLESAVELVFRRGQVMARSRGNGAMAVTGLSASTVRELIESHGPGIAIAAINSPANTVVAGDQRAVAAFESTVKTAGGWWIPLQSEYAFHSPVMQPLHADLVAALAHIKPGATGRSLYSSVTGRPQDTATLDANYWAENVVRPVLFADAVRAAAETGLHNVILEIGPHAVLSTSVAQSLELDDPSMTCLATMRRGTPLRDSMLDSVAALHVQGFPVDLRAVQGPAQRVTVPGYQWQRQKYWLPTPAAATAPAVTLGTPAAAPVDELAELCYNIDWQPAERIATEGSLAIPGTWVLLADGSGLAELVANRLTTAGHLCRIVPINVGPSGTDQLAANAMGERVGAAIAGADGDSGQQLSGVIHFAATGPQAQGQSTGPDFDSAVTAACAPMLAAAQQLASISPAASGTAPRLWLVTRGAVPAAPGRLSMSSAPAWGLGRVVGLEMPENWGGMIDLDPAGSEIDGDAARIVEEIEAAADEDQLAFRGGRRLIARMIRVDTPAEHTSIPRLDSDAAYLITGGRGNLGLRIAAWLAERGARHLVLVGRSAFIEDPGEPESLAGKAIRELRAAGVQVHTPCADVADGTAMAGLFDSARTRWPVVRGVVHAAGVFEPSLVTDLSWERFRHTLRPKLDGTMVLDSVTAHLDLQFLVMFSSAAAVWGSALAGHYAAANYSLDAIAHDRAARSLAGSAINWGWWAGTEMGGHDPRYFEAMGLGPVPDAVGFDALDRMLNSGRPQLTVAQVDWTKFRPVLEARRRRPLLEFLGGGEIDLWTTQTDLVVRLTGAGSAAERVRMMESALQLQIAEVLGRDPAQRIDPHLGFFDTGMDSITSVELKHRLDTLIGRPLAATAAIEHPTVVALAEHILSDVLQITDDAPTPAEPEVGAGSSRPGIGRTIHANGDSAAGSETEIDLDAMSEDELIQLLEQELEKGGTP